MEVAIVCGYNRPEYFKEVMRSLKPGDVPCYFFLDGGPEATQDEYVRLIESARLKNFQIVRRDGNIGCGNNLIEARRTIFDALGFESAVVVEDDHVLSPFYFSFMQRFMEWAGEAVTAPYRTCLESIEWKRENLYKVREEVGVPLWSYGITKGVWDKIKPHLYHYQTSFLGGHYKSRPNKAIQEYFRAYSDKPYFQGNCPTGQDAATIHALNVEKIPMHQVWVNRLKNIGVLGEHFYPEAYERHKLSQVALDPFPSDQEEFSVESV